MMTIILDAAHGINVPGKASPVLSKEFQNHPFVDDTGRFREYLWSRALVDRLRIKLAKEFVPYVLTVEPKNHVEPGLSHRVKMANRAFTNNHGKTLFTSYHCDAIGLGDKFEKANGWAIWTSRGATKSDKIASMVFEHATTCLNEFGHKFRKDYSDGDADYESNFAVLMCLGPAFLTENLFQTNAADIVHLLDEQYLEALANMYTECYVNLQDDKNYLEILKTEYELQ